MIAYPGAVATAGLAYLRDKRKWLAIVAVLAVVLYMVFLHRFSIALLVRGGLCLF